jgi:hypothetical protein
MAIREWWINQWEPLAGADLAWRNPENAKIDCEDHKKHLEKSPIETIHVIDATGMPIKEDINIFLDNIDCLAVGEQDRNAYDKVVDWLEQLVAE